MQIFKNTFIPFLIAFALVNLCTSHSLSAHDDNPSTLSDSLASALHPQLRFMRVFGAQDETALL